MPPPPTPQIADGAQAPPFLPWMSGTPTLGSAALSLDEARMLEALHALLALPTIPDNLLPRAAELVPQLIGMLRETQLPLQAMAERINKDAVLTAEVMRLANSPYYRAQGQVVDTVQALRLVGAMGLQTVIARVVLKPIYRSSAAAMGPEIAARLWEHSEALARHTAALAEDSGLSALDGFLVGMLHNTGWTLALGAIARAGLVPDAAPSAAFVSALAEQVHRLFGHAAQRWAISPGFTAFARDARDNGLAGATHAMAPVLQKAQALCMQDMPK